MEERLRLPVICAGILLLSFSVLVYEIALTRIASVVLTYHYAFLVVSLSLLGLSLAAAFRRYAARSGLLYGSDLLGAAAGSLAVVPLLNGAGAPSTVTLAGLAGSASGLIFLSDVMRRDRAAVWPLLAIAATGSLLWLQISGSGGDIPVGRSPDKDLYRFLSHPAINAEIIETRWSAFGRSDMVRRNDEPDMLDLFVDGAAGTAMYRWPEGADDSSRGRRHEPGRDRSGRSVHSG